MKVITIWQPWASLVVLGHKRFETRSWETKYRGPLLIHAAKFKCETHRVLCRDFKERFKLTQLPDYDQLPVSAIIGMVDLAHTEPTEHLNTFVQRRFSDDGYNAERDKLLDEFIRQERALGDYTMGRFFWELSNPVEFMDSIPYKGLQGMWNFEDVGKIFRQLPADQKIRIPHI